VKGLNEVAKALDRKDALLCVLAEDCEDAKYKKLIHVSSLTSDLLQALCKTNNIPLIEVEKRADLGEWLGQCKYDKKGVARRVRGASSVAIKDYGEESEALNFVLNHIKENQH
jgi:small subunit ribosomal protein S12e